MLEQRIYKSIISIALMIVLLVGALPTFAQTVDEVELVGTLSAMTSTTVTVNGQEISIIGAKINMALTIGDLVKVHGTLDDAGSITAREINAPDEGAQNGDVEIVGVLESFDGTTMVTSGQSFDVSGAEIKAGVAVGELVKIHASSTGTNMWQAREVERWMADDNSTSAPTDDNSNDNTSDDTTPDDNNNDNSNDDNGLQVGEFELVGTLESVGDGFVMVSGQTIDISSAEVKDMLVEGVLVKIHLSTVNGELIAREIENQFGDDNSNDNTAGDDNSNANNNDNTANNNSADDNSDDSNGNSNDNSNSNSNDNVSGSTAVSIDDATATVLSIYPNTTITEIELDDFADMLVWKIKTSHGIELQIDAQTGVILTIERDGNNNGSANTIVNSNSNDNNSANDNFDDNSGMGSDDNRSNSNSDDNSNDNSDDHNDNRDDDRDDDNSGMGSSDDDDDD